MPTFEHSELLPEHEILQFKIPTATEEANQINDWKYCYKLLILRSARVLATDTFSSTVPKSDDGSGSNKKEGYGFSFGGVVCRPP
jgi:hypothetical protein